MEEGVKMIKKILMIGDSSSMELEGTEFGVQLISCSSCSQYFKQLLKQDVGILLFVSEINITLRETVLCATQFPDCPFLIYLDTKDEKEEQQLKQEVELLLEEYALDKNKILVTKKDITQQQLIEKLLLCANDEKEECHSIKTSGTNSVGGICDFVKTYRKTRKPFPRKLDK